MAKAGAPKGNSNAAKGKVWRDALLKALKQYEDKPAGIKRGQAMARVANKVIEDALAGNNAAWQEIGNRLDGKPATSVTVSGDEDNPLRTVTRIERVVISSDDTED